MKCRINKGAEQVFAPNNNESILFNKLNSIIGDFTEALNVYSVTETQGFNTYSSLVKNKGLYDLNGEPDVETLMKYINNYGESTASKEDVITMMESEGITDSSRLLEKLSKVEILGIPIFSLTNLENTGLFSTFEAENISKNLDLQENLKQVLKYLRLNDDFYIDSIGQVKTDEITYSGKRSTEAKLSEDKAIDVDLKRPSVGHTINRVFSGELARDISFLVTAVTESTWNSSKEAIKYILNSIEKKSLDLGVDIRGLTNSVDNKSREDVLDMIDAVEAVLAEEITVEQFDLTRDEYFDEGTIEEYRDLADEDIIIRDNLTEDQAYQEGLIKLSDDAYKRIPEVSYQELLETQSELEGISVEEMQDIVNREFDRSLEFGSEIFLMKRNLEVITRESKPNVTNLDNFQGDMDYLQNDFLRDFLKGANMNYFNIDFRGITFKQGINREKALNSLEPSLRESLEQYSLISPYITMPYDVAGFNPMVDTQLSRAKHLANPDLAPKYNGDTYSAGDAIAVRNKIEQFLNIQGVLHELVNQDQNLSYYKPVTGLNKPVMETNPNDFTALRTLTKESRLHKSKEAKAIKDKYFKC